MRNMLAFFAAVVLTVAGVGFYLDWFNIRSTPSPDGHRSITLDVDTEKISEDFHKAEERLQKRLAEKAREKQPPVTPKMPPAEDSHINVFIDQ
jgi:hypothetical protein